MTKPTMEHRHFVLIADIIATGGWDDAVRHDIAMDFAMALRRTNPRFDADRFVAAAKGKPSNGRDKVR